jgi:hypothetical protein
MPAWLFQLLLGQARHFLTALGASFATAGILTNDEVQAAVAALIALISIAFSAWDKFKRRPKTEA